MTGYHATPGFDWYTESITVIDQHRPRADEMKIEVRQGHGGADAALARKFIDVIRRQDTSRSTLADGLLSAAMCIAAQKSELRQSFEPVGPPLGAGA